MNRLSLQLDTKALIRDFEHEFKLSKIRSIRRRQHNYEVEAEPHFDAKQRL